MGNKESQPEFRTLMHDLKSQKFSKKLSVRPEQKYRHQIIESIRNAKLPAVLKESVEECLIQNIERADLISTVSVISTLMRNNFTPQAFQSTIYPSHQQNRHVVINFNPERFKKVPKKRKPSGDKFLETVLQEMLPDHKQRQKQQDQKRLRFAEKVLAKEMTKQYHPFTKMTKVFSEFLVKIFLTEELAEEEIEELQPEIQAFFKERRSGSKISKKADEQDRYEELLRKFIHQWCLAVHQSCLKPYKKWILYYTELPEKRYNKWITHILIDQIWSVNQGYLFQIISLIIENNQPRIRIPRKLIDQALVTPAIFQIDEPLQIEGTYGNGIYEMAEFSNIITPSGLFEHLAKIKNSICTDVDKYYDLERKLAELESSQSDQREVHPVYEINSDNIMGIICYVIYKVSSKIHEICRQCIFLRIIYGDAVYYTFDQSSYMLSTIISAIEYLESDGFKEVLRNATITDDKKSTNVTTDDKSKELPLQPTTISFTGEPEATAHENSVKEDRRSSSQLD